MNRRDIPAILADLDDVASRCRDAGADAEIMGSLSRARGALYVLSQLPDTPSMPPLCEANQPKRTAATVAFQRARKLLEGVK